MQQGAEFPPLLVVFDGTSYWLVDGFHRRWAAIKAKLDKFKCEVVEGTREHARWLSYGVNKEHGVRRRNEDIKKAVIAALKHPRGAKLSDHKIAEHVGVSHPTVIKYREQLAATSKVYQSDEREGRDGRTINTANIGRKPAPKKEPMPPKKPDPKPDPAPQLAVATTTTTFADRHARPNGKPEQPARTVFVRLRALFDEMTPAERQTAIAMWNDWLDGNDPETPLWGEQNKE